MKRKLTTFHDTGNIDTSGDGVELPEGAVIDSVDHLSQGEYVRVTYHVTREVEDAGDDDGAAA